VTVAATAVDGSAHTSADGRPLSKASSVRCVRWRPTSESLGIGRSPPRCGHRRINAAPRVACCRPAAADQVIRAVSQPQNRQCARSAPRHRERVKTGPSRDHQPARILADVNHQRVPRPSTRVLERVRQCRWSAEQPGSVVSRSCGSAMPQSVYQVIDAPNFGRR